MPPVDFCAVCFVLAMMMLLMLLLMFVVCCLLFVVCCLLFVVCCLLFCLLCCARNIGNSMTLYIVFGSYEIKLLLCLGKLIMRLLENLENFKQPLLL